MFELQAGLEKNNGCWSTMESFHFRGWESINKCTRQKHRQINVLRNGAVQSRRFINNSLSIQALFVNDQQIITADYYIGSTLWI